MWSVITSIFKFIAGVFSDQGEPSSSRVLSAVVVVAAAFCLIFLTVKNHAIPDLGSLTAFVSAIVGVLYGMNQAKSASISIFGKKDDKAQ